MKNGRKKRDSAHVIAAAETKIGGTFIVSHIAERVKSSAVASRIRLIASELAGRKDGLITLFLPALYALLFSGVPFEMGIYPFGLCALCAASGKIAVALCALAAAIGSLGVRGGFFIALFALIGAAAMIISEKASPATGKSLTFRAILSLIINSAAVLLMSAGGGISFYELCAAVLMLAVSVPLTCALSFVFGESGRHSSLSDAGVCALLFSTAYALRVLGSAGASTATVLSLGGTLVFSYSFGLHRGLAVSVAFGLAAAPELTLIYPCAALIFGVLSALSPAAAVASATACALALAVIENGAEAIGMYFPEFIFTAAVAAPLLQYRLVPRRTAPSDENGNVESAIIRERLDTSVSRLRGISQSFEALSGVMRGLSRALSRPSLYELRQTCDEAFDESCKSCDNRDKCWDEEYRSTAAALTRMASRLRSDGKLDISSLPDGVRSRCEFGEAIVGRINLACSATCRTTHTNDNAAVSADDYSAISKILSDAVAASEEEFSLDRGASQRAAAGLSGIGLAASEVSVYGKRRRSIFARGLSLDSGAGSDDISRALAAALECAMSMPEYTLDGNTLSFHAHTAESFTASAGKHSVAKSGEYCGDSVSVFSGDGGYFFSLVADGMGSGKDAAMTSGVSAVFLERMLGAGCSLANSLEMLSSFLSRRNIECFTTIDLMQLDLVTGEASFVKSGAAPSFVLRGDRLFRLTSETCPVGIIRSLDGEILKFSAGAGDIVIMLSDGAVPDGGECPWLYDLLCGDEPLFSAVANLGDAAEKIASAAVRHVGDSDDISVAVIKIESAR